LDLQPVVKRTIDMQGRGPFVSGRLRGDNLLGWDSAHLRGAGADRVCCSALISDQFSI